jgi:CDP-diacylglycerol--serine O-phosphatidyltransferase
LESILFPPLGNLNLPNVATTLSALSGLAAMLVAARGQIRVALSCLLASIFLDRIDGLLARRLGRSSDFGRELDSLADAVAFCVAPALIGYFAVGGALVTGGALIYCVAGLWRLAHFNVTGLSGTGSEERFVGVPTTVAASWYLIALAGLKYAPATALPPTLAALYLVLAALMVSALPFAKHGWLVKSLYLLLPLAMLLVWWR